MLYRFWQYLVNNSDMSFLPFNAFFHLFKIFQTRVMKVFVSPTNYSDRDLKKSLSRAGATWKCRELANRTDRKWLWNDTYCFWNDTVNPCWLFSAQTAQIANLSKQRFEIDRTCDYSERKHYFIQYPMIGNTGLHARQRLAGPNACTLSSEIFLFLIRGTY